MVKLQDLSDLMQKIISVGATFMVSQSGIKGFYNVHAAHYNKTNKQVNLVFQEKYGVIVQNADENHPIIQFDSVDNAFDYMCKEIGAWQYDEAIKA